MEGKTAWEAASETAAKTASERYLARLARKAFLSLWSYPNVYTDEGRAKGKGDGKELCDLLVVFGNHVLIFSDKECTFTEHPDIKVAWGRWYKRAVDKSVKQLVGAEKFLRAHPDRIFLDKECSAPFPIPFPDPASARIHRIAVTRGSYAAAHEYWSKQSSGSLMIDTSLDGQTAHLDVPFSIGWPDTRERFVHVLDEMILDVLLEELDTLPDLIAYLEAKERFLTAVPFVSVAGEEQLVARYQMTMKDNKHALPEIPEGFDSLCLGEGDWEYYCTSQERAARREADIGSYMWDALIEYQSGFIRSGKAHSLPEMPMQAADHERVVRALADESRFSRRLLAHGLRGALEQNHAGHKFARLLSSATNPERCYVFLIAPRLPDISYEEYRALRAELLLTYCHALKLKYPAFLEAVGIASEPMIEAHSSQDFVVVSLDQPLTEEDECLLREACEEYGVLQDATMIERPFRATEYPHPRTEPHSEGAAPVVMNRAMRRAKASHERRTKKDRRG